MFRKDAGCDALNLAVFCLDIAQVLVGRAILHSSFARIAWYVSH